MTEGLKSFGSLLDIGIYRYENDRGTLSGIIFKADQMLITARHIVDSRQNELTGFEFYRPANNEYDENEVDVAIKRDANIRGPKIGYSTNPVLDNCVCVTSMVNDPSKLVEIPGRIVPFYEPTLLSRFVPDDESGYMWFGGGSSGSPIKCREVVVGVIAKSNIETKIVLGPCFNLGILRELLNDCLGLQFTQI